VAGICKVYQQSIHSKIKHYRRRVFSRMTRLFAVPVGSAHGLHGNDQGINT